MTQLTVEKLYQELGKLIKRGQGNKVIVVADDNEGNGYHGIYYSVTSIPEDVQECINASNGLSDSQEEDYKNIVIIG
jgi:hypothetical protein